MVANIRPIAAINRNLLHVWHESLPNSNRSTHVGTVEFLDFQCKALRTNHAPAMPAAFQCRIVSRFKLKASHSIPCFGEMVNVCAGLLKVRNTSPVCP